MLNKASHFIILGALLIASTFFDGLFLYTLAASILITLFFKRGYIYFIRANRQIIQNNDDAGYRLLKKAYLVGGIPFSVYSGYIYLSLKFGYLDNAGVAIDEILSGKKIEKLKDSQRKTILTQKALYLWKRDLLDSAIKLLDELYESGYKNTAYYQNYGFLIYESGELEKALKISLEGLDFSGSDKVILDNLVATYIAMDNYSDADKYCQELMELNPSFAEAYFHGAIIEANKGNIDKSLELIDRCRSCKITQLSSVSQDEIDDLESKIKN